MKEHAIKQQTKSTLDMTIITLKNASILDEQSALTLFTIHDDWGPNTNVHGICNFDTEKNWWVWNIAFSLNLYYVHRTYLCINPFCKHANPLYKCVDPFCIIWNSLPNETIESKVLVIFLVSLNYVHFFSPIKAFKNI